MKYYKSKTSAFFNGKGFYVVMALCVIALGLAAYSAMDSAKINNSYTEESQNLNTETKKNDTDNTILNSENTNSTKSEIKTEKEPDTEEKESLNATATDTNTTAEFFTSPLQGSVSKNYDSSTLQYSATYNDLRLHIGTDIVPSGSLLVNSCGAGTVSAIDTETIMGDVITIDHGNGIYIRYCGVKNIKVSVGDITEAGMPIAEVGTVTNECAEEAHLHLEVIKDGEQINPLTVIPIS